MAKLVHPCAASTHVLFKVAALLTYILCEWFSDNFVVNFVVTTILIACDFWTVKNVSGRFLVGLRWWHEVNEDGSSQWKFESLSEEGLKTIDSFEKRIFWWSMYGYPLVWILLGVVTLFRLEFEYLMLVLLALGLSLSNLYGYIKASRDQSKQISDLMGTAKTIAAVKNLI
eukprot:CAMPEP_0197471150 /NCGR_PEP_ID=MMETSP1309-20131121/2032_1 /TAXON_ID=464262 /ORGANISM="Genus nov. species nov., Strain RCC998" /LENGTH=170 /DNA_ID=CAMNT_0043008629 /DNA_START=72 /DNA_END=584 /DNA_ORIENTATION=-